MRAAVVTDFRSPLQVQDLPIPEPGAGEVLVRIETSGLCHTDIHAAHGDWPVKPTPPFIPGHEGVGYVEKLGTGVSTRAIGDRVAIAWLGYACGECRYCNGGWETLCEKQQNSGYSVNGTFAEYAVVPAAFAAPVPDGVSSRDAAPLTCAGVTTYKAIKVARVAPAETVAIFGVGGLGHLALQYARIAGGFVIAVDNGRSCYCRCPSAVPDTAPGGHYLAAASGQQEGRHCIGEAVLTTVSAAPMQDQRA